MPNHSISTEFRDNVNSIDNYIFLIKKIGFEQLYEENITSKINLNRPGIFYAYALKNPLVLLCFNSFSDHVNDAKLYFRWMGKTDGEWCIKGLNRLPILDSDILYRRYPCSYEADARDHLDITIKHIFSQNGYIFNYWWNFGNKDTFKGFPNLILESDYRAKPENLSDEKTRLYKLNINRLNSFSSEWKDIFDINCLRTYKETLELEEIILPSHASNQLK